MRAVWNDLRDYFLIETLHCIKVPLCKAEVDLQKKRRNSTTTVVWKQKKNALFKAVCSWLCLASFFKKHVILILLRLGFLSSFDIFLGILLTASYVNVVRLYILNNRKNEGEGGGLGIYVHHILDSFFSFSCRGLKASSRPRVILTLLQMFKG